MNAHVQRWACDGLTAAWLGERHNSDLASVAIGNFKRPALKATRVPKPSLQHLSRDHLGVFPRFFIPGKFVTVRIRGSLPSAHDDVEKVSWHS
jgi:hypothetical protein